MLTLKKAADRDFIILNLSDPQMDDAEWAEGHLHRAITEYTVKTIVDRVHPDLITVSGDLSWSGNFHAYSMLAKFLDTFGVPWSVVWGNHDNQGGAENIDRVVEDYFTHPLFTYEKGDPAFGSGNFVIRIEEDGKPVTGIIMMDSHDRMPYTNAEGKEEMDWAKLIPPQIDWYREQVRALRKEGCNDSAIIMHIPNYAYRTAYAEACREGIDPMSVDPHDSTGPKYWNPGYENSFGVNYEGICSYSLDDGVMDAVLEEGSTKHILVGHDHTNNSVIPYKGVKLCYSMKCGAGCYWTPKLNGGTILTVGKEGIKQIRHEFVNVDFLLADKK